MKGAADVKARGWGVPGVAARRGPPRKRPEGGTRMIVRCSKRAAILLIISALWLGCGRHDGPEPQVNNASQGAGDGAQAGNMPDRAKPRGIVPYAGALQEKPVIHEPNAEYLLVYWRDFKPTADAPLTKESVLAAIEKRLNRPLSTDKPQVAIRFNATGHAKNGPLPDWFKPEWRAPPLCNTAADQQLPAWTDPEQLAAHAELVKALASALDGHPRVAWVEPGSYGFWGEGHIDGAPAGCVPRIETREALARPWVENFRRTPLSVTMNWMRNTDDPAHRLRTIWGSAASIGLRFDCLGFWHDQYGSVVEAMDAAHLSGWTGPWGGEFCWGEDGARWAMGSDKFANGDILGNAPPAVLKMKGDERRKRVLDVVRHCGWSYLAGAGGTLLEKELENGKLAKELEGAMTGAPRDLRKCAEALRAGHK